MGGDPCIICATGQHPWLESASDISCILLVPRQVSGNARRLLTAEHCAGPREVLARIAAHSHHAHRVRPRSIDRRTSGWMSLFRTRRRPERGGSVPNSSEQLTSGQPARSKTAAETSAKSVSRTTCSMGAHAGRSRRGRPRLAGLASFAHRRVLLSTIPWVVGLKPTTMIDPVGGGSQTHNQM